MTRTPPATSVVMDWPDKKRPVIVKSDNVVVFGREALDYGDENFIVAAGNYCSYDDIRAKYKSGNLDAKSDLPECTAFRKFMQCLPTKGFRECSSIFLIAVNNKPADK